MGEILRNRDLKFKLADRKLSERRAQSAIDRETRYASGGDHLIRYERDILFRERQMRKKPWLRVEVREGREPHGIIVPSKPTINAVILNSFPRSRR